MSVDNKIIIGITGFIFSGKTEVANYFKKKGFYCIDVDKFAHSLYKRGANLYKKLIKIYGKNILKNNNIDRKKLRDIVFKNRKTYKKFVDIIYPELNKKLLEKIKNSRKKVIILDMAVLFESGFYKYVDLIIFVNTNKDYKEKLIKMSNRNVERKTIEKIEKYQKIFSLSKKIALSDFILYNNKNKKVLGKEVKKVIKVIKQINGV